MRVITAPTRRGRPAETEYVSIRRANINLTIRRINQISELLRNGSSPEGCAQVLDNIVEDIFIGERLP